MDIYFELNSLSRNRKRTACKFVVESGTALCEDYFRIETKAAANGNGIVAANIAINQVRGVLSEDVIAEIEKERDRFFGCK